MLVHYSFDTDTIPQTGSYYGKPNLTIHYKDIQCAGGEQKLDDCTKTILPLQTGKSLLSQTAVAGVKCYTPNQCVPPSVTSGGSCQHGQLRFSGKQSSYPEGNLQFCYHGTWSPFCSLGPNEAVVACRQLGYTSTNCKL